ncbi:aromatic amino acid transporter [Ferrimonas futtsuensis]|uniref:aromatic amino acid transporter n=1 Tax=Ferrimonas futtsuensis TaxID=364764 RepID=UPI00047F4876|nr:aromatic amino acid transporter [Ferrimonas futtsuensis]
MTHRSSPGLLGGAMIIAATTVGAGMFSLPVTGAGMWYGYSLAMLAFAWLCMLLSGLFVLETNLHFPVGASFDSMVGETLGRPWRVANGVSIAFVLYILTYAYISGGSSIVSHGLSASLGLELGAKPAALCFAGVLAIIVWLGAAAVDRLSTIMIGAMLITFAASTLDLAPGIEAAKLFPAPEEGKSYAIFGLAALPFMLASFGYHGNVPSLVKYYGKQPRRIALALLLGTGLAFTIYLLWLTLTFGNLSQQQMLPVIQAGGNMGDLVAALEHNDGGNLGTMLSLFANLAVASSFLGVTLGLFDFIADLFGFDNSVSGRSKTAAITFLPPLLLALAWPHGFIYAIGFAGLAATLWAAIVPALMARAVRRRHPSGDYRAPGGQGAIWLVVAFGLTVALCEIAGKLQLLPVFGQ